MVISDGKTRIAQYGQWDGYPSGQGKTILEFLRTMDKGKFMEKLDKCRFLNGNKRKAKEMDKFMQEIGCVNGWMDNEQSQKYHEKYPFLSRDHGGEVLQLIQDTELDEILLNDESEFVKDSLFCEWAYVVDFDTNTFEVYEGFNKTPLDKSERFYSDENNQGYYPVKLVKSFDLNNLPVYTDFIREVSPEED
jgi:hypothetical protein